MDSQTFENNKKYAGEKKPSMKRRAVDHDYHERRIYMITMAVEGRRPLLGRLEGDVNAPRGTAEAPHIVPTALGEAVAEAWHAIPRFHPEISTMAFQLMPDHIHGILFVKRHMEAGLGKAILGFKQGCNKAYRLLLPELAERKAAERETEVAVIQRHTKPTAEKWPSTHKELPGTTEKGPSTAKVVTSVGYAAVSQRPTTPENKHGLLFEHSYHDRILLRAGQLDTMRAYLADNPYRLAMKRTHPELLRVHTDIDICGRKCSAVGNLNLLHAPRRIQVRISRSIDPMLLTQEQQRLLAAAHEGAVLVSPAISPGEKAVMRAAFDAKLPLIVLLDNGISPMDKPSGQRFQATAAGQMLLISPFPHQNEHKLISRNECNVLNALAWDIARS